MKQISNNFREALRGIRQLNAIVTYESESATKLLTTESNIYLTTELGEIIGGEKGDILIESNAINNINPLVNVELFKTICKSIRIDVNSEIPINTWLNVKIGVLVNDDYEYLDFGDYYVTETKYNADTKSYIVNAYDKMVEAMKPFELSVTYPITIKNLLINIFTKLDWEYELDSFVNENKILTKDLFSGQNLTYRDVLDNISQVIVGNICFDKKIVKVKYINKVENSTLIPFEIPQTLNVETINEDRYITEDDLKDTNVTINKKYGPLNAILISNNDVVLDNLEDSVSIETSGKTEYNFKDNLILINDSNTFIIDTFNVIKGLEYYLYDFDTFGKLYFEPLDEVVVKIGEDEYKTLILNDDIKLTTGLEETMYVEEPEQTTREYIVNDINEKKLNNALVSIDKANAEIVLKADSNGKVVQARLDADGDEGTTFEVKADNIKLEGYTTINDGFSIDENGNMNAINGTFTSMDSSGNKVSVGPSYYGIRINNSDQLLYLQPELIVFDDDYYGFNTEYGSTGINIKEGNSSRADFGVTYSQQGYYGDSSLYSTSGMETIRLNGNTGNIKCVSLTQTSLEESKKNIEIYSNALEEVLKTDIYSYNYKNEDDKVKKHLGFVIGENRNYSSKITSVDENGNEIGVDSYSMISLCLQAIKEQQEKIEELEQRIEHLERNDK